MYNNGNILFIYNFWEKKSNQRQSTFITFTFAELTARHLPIYLFYFVLCANMRNPCVSFFA